MQLTAPVETSVARNESNQAGRRSRGPIFRSVRLSRIGLSCLGALLVIASIRYQPDPIDVIVMRAERSDPNRAVSLYEEALRADSASPYRWVSLAHALAKVNQIDRARQCFRRALALAPSIPGIWLKDCQFHFQLGESQEALRSAARVLEIVPDYDPVLFDDFDRLVPDAGRLLAAIGNNQRATRSYFVHEIAAGSVRNAAAFWRHLSLKGFGDDQLASSYVDLLLRNRSYDEALKTWSSWLAPRTADYPQSNLLYNGGFELKPTGSALDWRIVDGADVVETIRDENQPREGRWGLKISFQGRQNVFYRHVSQDSVLSAPGRYRLAAWIRTEGITTNEGLRLNVLDAESPARLDARTDSVSGTHAWMPLALEFTASPQTRLVRILVTRQPSSKFDNKIAGTAWLDSFSLVGIH